MLEGGDMSKQDIEEKLHAINKQYKERIKDDKERMEKNRRESATICAKMANLQQRLCELKEERIAIQQRLSAEFERYNEERHTERENLRVLERTGLA